MALPPHVAGVPGSADRLVYLDGRMAAEAEVLPDTLESLAAASAPVVYDALRTFNGAPFKLRAHIERLYRSLIRNRLDPGIQPMDMIRASMQVLEANARLLAPGQDYLLVHVVAAPVRPEVSVLQRATALIYCHPLDLRPFAALYALGAPVVSVSTDLPAVGPKAFRRQHGARSDAISARFEAMYRDPEAFSLMLDPHGYVSECVNATFLTVAGGRIRIPDRQRIAPGISLETVMEIAGVEGIKVEEAPVTLVDVFDAQEAFLAASEFCLLPATSVDGNRIGDGKPGPMTRMLLARWSERVGVDIVEQAQAQLQESRGGFRASGPG